MAKKKRNKTPHLRTEESDSTAENIESSFSELNGETAASPPLSSNDSITLSLEVSDLLVFVAFTVLFLLTYGQVIQFDFINLDDNLYVYSNANVTNGLTFNGIQWAFTTYHASNWHPLTWISHMIDVSLFGVNPGMIHAVNALFHLVNSFLVFSVFHKLTRAYWPSAVVAFLFAFHPAHVESVAWISERKDVLCTLFWLLTIWAYARFAENNERSKLNYGLVILFFTLGILAKPMIVTLPFVLLLLDYWPLERLKGKKDIWPLLVEKIPLFALTIGSSVITVLAQGAGGAISPLSYISLDIRVINTVVSYVKYIWMLFSPLKLGIMYPYPTLFNFWQIVFSSIFLLSVTAFCWWQAKKRKYLIVGWLWYLGTLVPAIGLVQVGSQSMADRYTYVPYLGLFVILVWGAADVLEKRGINKRLALAAACIVLIVLSALTYKQVSYWKNAESIYAHTMEVTENNILIMDNNCLNYIRQERLQEANEKCVALSGDHHYPNAYNTWGIIQAKLENYDEAIRNFQRCLSLSPGYTLASSNLAVSLSKVGRFDEATSNLQIADRTNDGSLSPTDLAGNYSLLAIAYMEHQQADKAAPIFERALALLPDRTDIRTNLGTALAVQGKYDDAFTQLDASIKRDPNQAEAYNGLGLVFLGTGKKEKAIENFRKALELNPDLTSAAKNLQQTVNGQPPSGKSPR